MLLTEMLGRRFEFVEPAGAPDATVIALDVERDRVRLHGADGSREWATLSAFRAAYERGAVLEAARAPFVLDSFDTKRAELRRYVAGKNKQPNPWIGVLR